jgi:hypothetical protein
MIVLFKVFDHDANGYISKNDLHDTYRFILPLNTIESQGVETKVGDIVLGILEFDGNKKGVLTRDDVTALLDKKRHYLDLGVLELRFHTKIISDSTNDHYGEPVQVKTPRSRGLSAGKLTGLFVSRSEDDSEAVSPRRMRSPRNDK